MTTYPYNRNLPNPPNDPADDVSGMQENSQSIDGIIAEDHVGFDTPDGGRHTVIHLVPQPSNPSLIGSFGYLYSKTLPSPVADETLFYRGGGAVGPVQLTLNVAPVAANNGYTFLPGGMLLQWGRITDTSTSFTTVLFATSNINFPNSCFGVFTQIYGSGTPANGAATVKIRASSISNLSFEYSWFTNSSAYTGFYWWAIGN